jgi:thymidylate synthase (FAD)
MLVSNHHESVLEHEKISMNFVIDRGISHELVRHKIGLALSQESTRYCNYGAQEIVFIKPYFFEDQNQVIWEAACEYSEEYYKKLLILGATAQEARTVLNSSLKTEIETSFNIRALRHVLIDRCSLKAHPQMRQVMIPTLVYLKKKLPALFSDIPYDSNFPIAQYAKIITRPMY